MGQRESFLLRIDPKVMEAIRLWARDDLRSVNSQIEFLLRRALADSGRMKKDDRPPPRDSPGESL